VAQATIEDLFRAHWSLVLGFLVRQTRDVHLAEEIAQETFVRAARAFLGWRGGSPAAWLLTIARNTLVDHHRKHGRMVVTAEVPEGGAGPDPEDEHVRDALDRLPERARRVLTLHYFAGFTLAEIAAMSGTTESAVKSAIHRARKEFELEYGKETEHV
jgi:RNA polymerase sigma-70 factor (ECF subfamily)